MKLYSELFCTYSMEEKNRIIDILEEHRIPYKISTNGNTMRNIGSRGMAVEQFGENLKVSCEYKIRVPKEQLEHAQHLLKIIYNSCPKSTIRANMVYGEQGECYTETNEGSGLK